MTESNPEQIRTEKTPPAQVVRKPPVWFFIIPILFLFALAFFSR